MKTFGLTEDEHMHSLALYGGDKAIPAETPLPEVFPREIEPRAYEYVKKVLDSGFTSGIVAEFENKFARMHHSRHAVSVANCTAAIHTALAALGVGEGDEVVTTPISDYGSYAGIFAQKAVPVFADIDPDTGNLTVESIERVISPRTKAIIVVHWHGLICDMDPILALSQLTGIPVIEDCCQCPLGEYKGRKAGTMGVMGCFSLDAEKHLSTEHGGMILTQDKELADRAYKFAVLRGSYEEEGYGKKYDMLGLNYRYGQLEAAVGMAQLDMLEFQNNRRRELAENLRLRLTTIEGLEPLKIPEGSMCLYWIFPLFFRMERFDANIATLGKALAAEGIVTCSHIPYYLITNSHFLLSDYDSSRLPGALSYISRTVRWVWSDKYSEADTDRIYHAIRKVADYFRKSS